MVNTKDDAFCKWPIVLFFNLKKETVWSRIEVLMFRRISRNGMTAICIITSFRYHSFMPVHCCLGLVTFCFQTIKSQYSRVCVLIFELNSWYSAVKSSVMDSPPSTMVVCCMVVKFGVPNLNHSFTLGWELWSLFISIIPASVYGVSHVIALIVQTIK